MRRKIFVMAWCIARDGAKKFGGKAKEYLSQALKMAWKEKKTIIKLKKQGCKHWSKGYHNRMYLDTEFCMSLLDMQVDYYKSGNVSYACIAGEKISNAKATRVLGMIHNCYLDLNTMQLFVECHVPDYEKKLELALKGFIGEFT